MLVAGAALVVLATPVWAQAQAAAGVSAPAVVAQTTSYTSLDIAKGQVPSAPDGKLLTLTVDGVELPLAPGHYTGDVVLTVTDDIPVQYHKLPTHHFRAALYVDGGQPVAAKSVTAAIERGKVGAGEADDVRIVSQGPRFNGILVTGDGKYLIDHPVIDLTGNGGNDFAGFGAAIMATGHADVTVNRPIIRTRGAIRTALFTGGNATMHVDGAEIEVENGTLPPDYKFTVEVGKMMEVPWMLGLSGNVRASNLVDHGTLYITNSHVRAQGWGALSTDENTHVRMFVKDSLIETVDSGYGSYSIGDSVNVFDHSIIRAADIGTIMAAQGSVTFTNGTLVESGRYGVMMHSGMGGGTLTIDKKSELASRDTAIEVKGIGTTIVVDDAKVSAGNGVILQAMENDDPFMKAMLAGHMPEGMGPPPPGTEQMLPAATPQFSSDVVGTFRNTVLKGDFYNGRTAQGAMTLTFENAAVTGRISTSTVASATGKEPTRETYQEIGHVVNTPAPTRTDKGLKVSLDAKSHWTVTGTSYLTSLVLAPGARIDAGAHTLRMTVNGKPAAVKPGSYQGAITLTVD